MYKRSGLGIFMSVIFLLTAAVLTSCSGKRQPPGNEAVPALTATAVRKTVPVQIRAIGNVEAYSTVGVKSKVDGELMQVHFKEGQDVYKGQLIITIDPRPFEAALEQARANLAKDTALLENARIEVRRYAELVKKGYVANEQFDQIRTNADTLEATVRADKAQVENARLQLSYCYIHSPVTGRTGSLLSNQGNLIKANADNPIVVINQIQPIYVDFSVPEQYLPEIKKYGVGGKIKVEAITGKDSGPSAQGTLTFMDNAVDAATGTIKLKGDFANGNKLLWPGQFVTVITTLTSQPDALVIPSAAVQTGQEGQYVFVIKGDMTAESRPVVVSRTIDGETVIQKGLTPGETVVTDGQLRLVPGSKVEIKKQ